MSQPAQTHPLLASLAQKHRQAREEFAQKHEFAKKWLESHGLSLSQIREHSTKLLTGATLSSALLLASPHIQQLKAASTTRVVLNSQEVLRKLTHLDGLTQETEAEIEAALKQWYRVSVAFELDHNRLPTHSGSMGLEQHLVRYPGDMLANHDEFLQVGMAPGRGAFGYFVEEDKSAEQAALEEKYYIVLQTFAISNWNRDWLTLKNWYKFRKFLVLNPETGKAVVTSLGDSGPATWTGKVFGGSPEVMARLGFYPGKTRGEVVVLYLDDPGNQVPLGPISPKGGL